ncbi:MAG TPA: acyl-CoA thioesterase [Bacteroidetes bacterium]|nr:acyl-CoA thioesterase [Bacteroidota bacterium]
MNSPKKINQKPTHISYIRVRYGETDRMGVLHHSVYPLYFEEARTDLLRKSEMSYKDLEDSGIILPVRDLAVTYYHPAFYDDILAVKVTLEEIQGVRLNFSYEITNENNDKVAVATTSLVFTDAKTFKPIRPSEDIVRLMQGIRNDEQ